MKLPNYHDSALQISCVSYHKAQIVFYIYIHYHIKYVQ